MSRELTPCQLIERSIQKRFRKELWTPFLLAVRRYDLIREGDRIAVCISGGKDSMLLAKMMQQLQRFSDYPFEVEYLVMDPGYNPENRRLIEENARRLELPVSVFETRIFDAAYETDRNPCYLCARMRRGHLYSRAREMGCNKIALGHHLNDVIETTVMAMFYGAQIQGMMPKVHSANFPGLELIRPLYCVLEDDIIAWAKYNGLSFLRCACRLTESIAHSADGVGDSKRQEVKEMIRRLRKTEPDIERRLFAAIHNVNIDTFPEWKTRGEYHSFLEKYDS